MGRLERAERVIMRVMVVHPGASFSTADVYDGLIVGLRAHGVNLIEGRLDTI